MHVVCSFLLTASSRFRCHAGRRGAVMRPLFVLDSWLKLQQDTAFKTSCFVFFCFFFLQKPYWSVKLCARKKVKLSQATFCTQKCCRSSYDSLGDSSCPCFGVIFWLMKMLKNFLKSRLWSLQWRSHGAHSGQKKRGNHLKRICKWKRFTCFIRRKDSDSVVSSWSWTEMSRHGSD